MARVKLFYTVIAALFGLGVAPPPAQAQPVVVSAGYAPPSIVLAPGALITIYVTGLELAGQSFSASSVPLPTTLGGISVTLTSQVSSSVPAAPLFSVASVPGAPQFTAITIEVPSEIYSGIPAGFAGTIAASQNGIPAPSVPTLLVESNVQVIKQCTAPLTQSAISAPSQSAYHRLIPGYIPLVAAFCRKAAEAPAVKTCLRGSWRAPDHFLSGRTGKQAGQRCTQSQPPTGSDPIFFPLCRAGGSRAFCSHSTRVVHSP